MNAQYAQHDLYFIYRSKYSNTFSLYPSSHALANTADFNFNYLNLLSTTQTNTYRKPPTRCQ